MGIFSYLVILLLVICWLIGLFGFHLGPAVHMLPVFASIVLLQEMARKKNLYK
jgi:Family of unknown function (DUF5670)